VNRRLERRIGAYRDGELSGAVRDALERRLAPGSDAARALQRTDALGRAVREAWNHGPQGPEPETLLTALRPGLTRVDAEIEENGVPWLDRLRARIAAAPAPVMAGAAAAVLLAVWLTLLGSEAGPPPITVADVAEPTVYDLSGEGPVLLFEDSDATVIWLVEEEDDLSGLALVADGWS
jgi:anti-sigma factor RsiW